MRNPKKKPLPLLENIEIIDAAAEGKSLARLKEPVGNLPENFVIFVENAVPGDIADLQLTLKKKSFAEARAVKFYKYSGKRTEAFCRHFGTCGGCKWQFMQYKYQLEYKQKQVFDNLTRLGKFEMPEMLPILGSEQERFYRNKLEFSFSNKRWLDKEDMIRQAEGIALAEKDMNALGFHIPGKFDKVLDITECYHQPEPSNSIRMAIKEYALKNNLTFYDIKNQQGFLRTMIIRNTSLNEWMLIVSFGHEDTEARMALLDYVANKFPQLSSLMYVINGKRNDTISDQEVILYKGKDHIMEQMEDLKFKIGPKSFFQTNSRQAVNLYNITRNFAGLNGHEVVYDLYTGTGTIANYVAHQASKVVGVEYVADAIEDAKVNSSINKISNTSFFAGDMKDVLNDEFITSHGKPDVIITDPPRAGMHADVINKMLEIEADRIVYVSCNPATQARDITLLDAKYKVEKIQPVDMFPHTHHVENVVLLKKRR